MTLSIVLYIIAALFLSKIAGMFWNTCIVFLAYRAWYRLITYLGITLCFTAGAVSCAVAAAQLLLGGK